MTLLRSLLLPLIALASLSGSPASGAEKLTVFAAASLKDALEAAGEAYASTTGTRIVFSFAGTSALARQLEAGAPADLFFSADQHWMDHVARAGAVDPATVAIVATNSLVFVAPGNQASPLALDKHAIDARLGGGRLAIGEPDSVPAGRYAREALTNLGLWSAVEAKLAPMENVRIALATVARGETPLGIVYASDAAVEDDVAVVASIPRDSHPAIVYPAAATFEAQEGAVDFIAFLKGPEGRKALISAGLQPVD
ncbi:molybdate ABC transporter substrate-binding protein [Stappia albiluteola]|nr:molybdate ABC transporter substrate-binding protein [Stappia albiluteola]